MGTINTLDKQYTDLLQDIIDNGVTKSDRTGTGTLSVFGRQIRHKMSEGFPLLTTKKMAWKTMVVELIWFLRGDTNIKFLLDYDCHIWDGDAYKNYQKNMTEWFGNESQLTQVEFVNKIKTDETFSNRWGDLGPIYGKQWRSWNKFMYDTSSPNWDLKSYPVDQIQNLINDLKTNPDSRRLMVNAWNVGELDQMVLPPCHYGFQVYTRELSLEERLSIADKFNPLIREDCLTKTHHPDETEELKLVYRHEFLDNLGTNVVPQRRAISLMWNQRSVDTFLGLPFNIASYGLLLEIIAKEVNMVPDELIGNLGDVHLYSNHIEQAKEQIGRDLTNEERYNIWFNNNYETGMERFFNPNELPDFDNEYYEPTPKRTREPYPLPSVKITHREWYQHEKVKEHLGEKTFSEKILALRPDCFELINYKSHPPIKAPLSN
jgi:thymidylate synthase